jgi:hypothetical protein
MDRWTSWTGGSEGAYRGPLSPKASIFLVLTAALSSCQLPVPVHRGPWPCLVSSPFPKGETNAAAKMTVCCIQLHVDECGILVDSRPVRTRPECAPFPASQ